MTDFRVPRWLLAQITTNPQAIQYLEGLGKSAEDSPLLLEQIQVIAQSAADSAASAASMAAYAQELAKELQTERALSLRLGSQVSTLQRKVLDLEALVIGGMA
jgi:hypothetical protein